MAQQPKAREYSVNLTDTLLNSRLWQGVPQITLDKLQTFDPAYIGHTFIFCVDMPLFMTQSDYVSDPDLKPIADTLHAHAKNLKAAIERASTAFSGQNPMTVNFADQTDGAGRKLSHAVSVIKEIDEISIRFHEFKGLAIKNAIEAWVTGIYDVRSQRASYHGLIGQERSKEFSAAYHTMSILVVQTDPTWMYLQDAAFYYNMIPTEVPFNYFDWSKGEYTIVEDFDIRFKCNEERGPAINWAAIQYMNNRVLNLVDTAAYDYKKFVPYNFPQSEDSAQYKAMTSDTWKCDDSAKRIAENV
jgi:hypothetical protein